MICNSFSHGGDALEMQEKPGTNKRILTCIQVAPLETNHRNLKNRLCSSALKSS